jgi:hypothetical protein
MDARWDESEKYDFENMVVKARTKSSKSTQILGLFDFSTKQVLGHC